MNDIASFSGKINVHAVWLSDIHLGYRDCKAGYLLDFLDHIEPQILYLVGDVVDVWSMSKSFYWPESHNRLLRRFLQMAREGVEVIYVPGNHDSTFREYCGESFGSIRVYRQAVHYTLNGKKLLVTHGDDFDDVVRFSKLIHYIGDFAYDVLLFANRWTYYLRRFFGYGYWSLAAHVKSRLEKAARAISLFEQAAIEKAREENCDGIVCGHIHHPNVFEKEGMLYFNDGDWVENCTTLVEKHDGVLELWHWSDRNQCIKRMNGERVDHQVEQLDLLGIS
jgi:UDP-2,3-diacylglucosamine pyrophosphatase LpxH